MEDIKRWYDRDPRMAQILDILKDLPENSQTEFARVLMQLINILRKSKKNNGSQLSIGKNKVLGMYKAFNRRRWYDQSTSLMNSLNTLSMLSDEDFSTIVDGILITLTNPN